MKTMLLGYFVMTAWFGCMSRPPKMMSQGGLAPSLPTRVMAELEFMGTFLDEDSHFPVHHEIFRDVFEEGWNFHMLPLLFLFKQLSQSHRIQDGRTILFIRIFFLRVHNLLNHFFLFLLLFFWLFLHIVDDIL